MPLRPQKRPSGDRQILFLGCGAGEFVIDAARAGAEAHGIDIAPTAIAMAHTDAAEAGITCDFVLGNVLAMPFADRSMDIAVDDHCLHCIIGNDRQEFLSEAKRVLKPDGILLVRSMCSVPENVEVDPATRCTIIDGIATRYFGTVNGLLGEIEKAGFKTMAHRVQVSDPKGSDMLEIEAIRP
jgi:ubiquinone/menaquinone biosynthesis C-methylase UbiE